MKILRIFFCICVPLSIIVFSSSCEHETDCSPLVPNTPCVSSKEYNPVCGCDNKTYGNPSMAKCAGIDKYTFGTCPK